MKSMNEGLAPMLSEQYCSNPKDQSRLSENQLQIVWSKEGDSASLFYKNKVICIIPSWASNECPGYSTFCIKQSELAFPLGAGEAQLVENYLDSKEFWNTWNQDSWNEIQEQQLGIITNTIGVYEKYYAIDNGIWPPKALITIEKDGFTYIITIGVSIIPQPKVELYVENPEEYRRIELGFVIKTELLDKNRDGILRYISAQTTMPWSKLSWLGEGHTIPCDQLSDIAESYTHIMLVQANHYVDIHYPIYWNDKVNLLWMVPISDDDLVMAKSNGSSSLIAELKRQKTDFVKFEGV